MTAPNKFDWVPDWILDAQRPAATQSLPLRSIFANPQRQEDHLSSVTNISSTVTPGSIPTPIPTPVPSPTPASIPTSNNDGFTRRQKTVVVTPNKERTVSRKLGGLQLAMITVNATLGTGLYWRSGQILELGGPLAVLLSYLIPGFLAWAVMQCISELLCIWPVPGAMAVYVSEFVDVELGITVGVAYWFTYSVSFAALIATAAAEIHFWAQGKGFDGGVVYFLIPLVLVLINCFPVYVYGWLEVLTSSLKIFFLFIVIGFLIAINVGVGRPNHEALGVGYWASPLDYDKDVSQNWVTALFMCISVATFAYVGVEIVAASALEARWPNKQARIPTDLSQRSDQELLIGKTVKFSSVYMPAIFTLVYVVSGVLTTFNIPRDDPRLPRLSWINSDQGSDSDTSSGTSVSVFVSIAQETTIPHLADAFNVFLVFTALSCANTNLYVASRSLFGLTSRLDGGSGQPILIRIIAWFGRTNRHKVPIRAMILSAVAFWWVPFLQLQGGNGIDMFIDVLATMGSSGVILVWACECWAFIRFYHCIYRHRQAFEAQKISQVRRWDTEDYNDYPYRSHLQPFLAYAALAGCIFILIVVDGAKQWNGFHVSPFLSSYLIILVFIGLWVSLKIVRGANWALVDLNNEARVINKIRELHDIRLGAS